MLTSTQPFRLMHPTLLCGNKRFNTALTLLTNKGYLASQVIRSLVAQPFGFERFPSPIATPTIYASSFLLLLVLVFRKYPRMRHIFGIWSCLTFVSFQNFERENKGFFGANETNETPEGGSSPCLVCSIKSSTQTLENTMT